VTFGPGSWRRRPGISKKHLSATGMGHAAELELLLPIARPTIPLDELVGSPEVGGPAYQSSLNSSGGRGRRTAPRQPRVSQLGRWSFAKSGRSRSSKPRGYDGSTCSPQSSGSSNRRGGKKPRHHDEGGRVSEFPTRCAAPSTGSAPPLTDPWRSLTSFSVSGDASPRASAAPGPDEVLYRRVESTPHFLACSSPSRSSHRGRGALPSIASASTARISHHGQSRRSAVNARSTSPARRCHVLHEVLQRRAFFFLAVSTDRPSTNRERADRGLSAADSVP